MPYYPHIYFESKKPGRDSVFALVHDIGKTGVNTPIEVAKIAVAQLWDYVDGYTKDHTGKVVPFTKRKWVGRYRILLILSKKYGGRRVVKMVEMIRKLLDAGILPKSKVREACKKALQCKTVDCIIKTLKELINIKNGAVSTSKKASRKTSKKKSKKSKKSRKKVKKTIRIQIFRI